MIVRSVSLRLKPNALARFTQILENEVVPALRKQPGFQDQITFAALGSLDVISMSLWDTNEHLDAYNAAFYPKVLKSLETVLDARPRVRVRTVINTTTARRTQAAA